MHSICFESQGIRLLSKALVVYDGMMVGKGHRVLIVNYGGKRPPRDQRDMRMMLELFMSLIVCPDYE